jgi:hypothetical protein
MGEATGDPPDRPPQLEDAEEAVKAERRENLRSAGQLAGAAAIGGIITGANELLHPDPPPKPADTPDALDPPDKAHAPVAEPLAATDVSDVQHDPAGGTSITEGVLAWSTFDDDLPHGAPDPGGAWDDATPPDDGATDLLDT